MKVLTIDDDAVFLNALLAQLSVDGFDVKGAYTGADGLSAVSSWKPDLLILDLTLPDMDGLELLSRLRDSEETKALPVIVCTNRGGDDDAKQCHLLGARDILLKMNYRLDQIVEKVEEAARKAGADKARAGT
jgi:CheY-like chemotaxis protein